MSAPAPFRIGTGYDVHRFTEGRPLILGGIEIPSKMGLLGHSDADVLSHAIADALLGAAGLPDIGYFFPPGNLDCAGINSQKILERALDELTELGYAIVNIDSVIIAEFPKIQPYREAMRTQLASTLKMDKTAINIKATTHEKLGDIGKGLGMAAHATCLLTRIL
jgi:2-C-methyl-D-erythritol 2,4-cyclodiphosphate synthase